MAKNLYIAATGKDVGKSTVSYALINYLLQKEYKVGFMKPVGQRWKKCQWGEVEEDVILIKDNFSLEEDPIDMNPVVVKKGFTEEYLNKRIKPDLSNEILKGCEKVSSGKDFVIIEGTGHAGVGSVLDHSNADVAKLLDAKVILIAKGGIGKTIDKLELTRIFFENKGLKIIGVIVNKTITKKIARVETAVKKYCKNKNLKFLGTIPYSPILGNPTLSTIIEEIQPEIFNLNNEKNHVIEHFLVGASQLEEAINFLENLEGKILLILPAERMDLTMAIPNIKKIEKLHKADIFAVLFTGNTKPSEYSIEILKENNINVLWKKGNTYSVVSKLSSISIKTTPNDDFKLKEIQKIVTQNISIKKILKNLHNSKSKKNKLQKIKTFVKKIFHFRKK